MSERFLAHGVAVGRLAAGWTDVVGERLAEETSPVRLEAGTLTVSATSGAWGVQIQFLAEDLRRRANEALGEDLVKRVRVVVQERPEDRVKPL
jgi:predicted nucleic acid-binding Zn ribbon protein